MADLAAFYAAVLGGALGYELTLLVGFVLILNIREALYAALQRMRDR